MEQHSKDYIRDKVNDCTSRFPNDPQIRDLIEQLGKALSEEIPLDDRLIAKVKSRHSYEISHLLNSVFNRYWITRESLHWTFESPVIKQLVQRKHYSNNGDPISAIIHVLITQWLEYEKSPGLFNFLRQQQFSDADIITIALSDGEDRFFQTQWSMDKGGRAYDRPLSAFGEFIVPLIKPSSGFLGFGKNSEANKIIDEAVRSHGQASTRMSWLALLTRYAPESIPKDISQYLLWHNSSSKNNLNVACAIFLIQEDVARYEPDIVRALNTAHADDGKKFYVYLTLHHALKGKYDKELRAIGEGHLANFKGSTQRGYYFHEPSVFRQNITDAYFDYLYAQNSGEATERIKKFFDEALYLNSALFPYAFTKFPGIAVDLLMAALRKNTEDMARYSADEYYKALFGLLSKSDVDKVRSELVQFAVEMAGKKTREMACAVIAGTGAALTDGRSLLGGKSVDERVTGALILSNLDNPEAKAALNEGVDLETNDDTRDIMLECLAGERFGKPLGFEEVRSMIALAAKRKKLNKWNEKWLDESVVPPLYWKHDGQKLDVDAVRFLFYRMKRAPGLNSDVEARQVIAHIDRSTSGEFAKALLKAFQDSNADVKIKYYLTLAALLGDNDMMSNLNSLFTKSMTDKRMKMAEYVVGALAMVGTDKALRLVETIYRKYANKKPAVSQAARGALDAAAKELNLTMDELSDRIIPNFDFEGIYKPVTIDGEEYRAFVNEEFKVNFLTEDNKVRKSLPSTAPKELKTEFRDMEKEISTVTKSQTIRLEKYLVEERRWTSDDWMRFFFNNPVMSVYAMKLLWAVFQSTGKLVSIFYCSQDGSLYDIDDNEVSLEPDHLVGILHPIYLSNDQLEGWKQKLYDMSMTTVFPIVDRGTISINPAEADLSRSQLFAGKNIPKGADFVNTYLVKKNWIRTTGDGGMSDFSKLYKDGLIRANANIEGPAAWYQGGNTPAKMYDVSFWNSRTRAEMKLKDLPPVFFSEVMSDIDSMIKAN